MKAAGFFRTLDPTGPPIYQGEIRDYVDPQALPDADQIVDYLRSGHGLIDIMGATQDVFGGDRYIIASASILTDGEWVWREDLHFYVANYRVRLPEEFLQQIRQHKYQVPDLEHTQLATIGEEAAQLLGYH